MAEREPTKIEKEYLALGRKTATHPTRKNIEDLLKLKKKLPKDSPLHKVRIPAPGP